MQQNIRLLLVEDETIVSEAICALLKKEANITIVGKADTAEAGVRKAQLLKPDVLLLDLQLPDRSGVGVIAEIVRDNPAVRIILLTAYAADDEVVAAFRAGAVGYVLKSQAIIDLIRAIEQATHEQSAMPPTVAHILLRQISRAEERTERTSLSEAEWRVLVLVAQGFANKEIARHLRLSCMTVNAHVSNILNKLNLANRTQVALYALKRGWVKLEAPPVQPAHTAQALPALVPMSRERPRVTL